MPHGWVASDFIRSTLDLFAYERDADGRSCSAPAFAGVARRRGVTVKALRTPMGR